MADQLTDTELLQLLAQNDEGAIDIIFKRYYSFLCRACYRILTNTEKSEDLVQDVFFELWKKRESLRINTSLKAYLKRATLNKALNHIRDERIKSVGEEPLSYEASKQITAQQGLEKKELQASIDQAISQLPERCRLVFVLSRHEEMTYQQIADKMGISIKTVENQITKALKLLRKSLKSYLGRSMILWLISFFC